MDPVRALIDGVLAPVLVAAVVVLAIRRPWRSGRADTRGWGVGIALAAAYGIGFALVLGWPALPPVDVTHATPWLAIVAAAIAALPARAAALRRAAVGILGLLTGALLVSPLLDHGLGGASAALHVFLVGATFVLVDGGLERALTGLEPRAGALAVTTLTGGGAVAVLLSDVASLAQVTGGLAAGLGALFALGLWRPAAADVTRATPVVAAVLASTLWSAVLYANGRYEVVALLAASPLVLWRVGPAVARTRRAIVALAIPTLVILLPIGAAAGLAARAYFAEPAAETAPLAVPDSDSPAADGYDPNYGY
ncbi:MAG: hypothetical protein CVU56_14970 [Deltaproteobacteria bacterium HGW-Deltaproteobacteria-14]|jgi:hypothetical protein|nr:MAG: hypothetical protein CVU56_14970 [Deltaproteobacteria bacterium HGW-Deltaproteobacteria-14]